MRPSRTTICVSTRSRDALRSSPKRRGDCMAAAGNVYRHEYEDVAARRVWQTLVVSWPLLLVAIEQELQLLDESS